MNDNKELMISMIRNYFYTCKDHDTLIFKEMMSLYFQLMNS